MQVGKVSGRKGAATQSKGRVCGPVFVQYEHEYSLLQEEYCLHEPVQRAHDTNADYHTHKVKSRTVGLFNFRSCYIIVYFVLRSAYEARVCCEQTPIQTINVMVCMGLLTTTVSPGTCMDTILNYSSPETS
jgi:hypothetical protein